MSKIIGFNDISRELIGEPLTNGEALEIVRVERDWLYVKFTEMRAQKGNPLPFEEIISKLRVVMAYDILINSFEQYLNHEK